jgi:hypothetical protein
LHLFQTLSFSHLQSITCLIPLYVPVITYKSFFERHQKQKSVGDIEPKHAEKSAGGGGQAEEHRDTVIP